MALPAQRGDDDIDDNGGDYCGDDGNTGTFNTKRPVRITMVILMTFSVMMVIMITGTFNTIRPVRRTMMRRMNLAAVDP